jgi:hypothetical protein
VTVCIAILCPKLKKLVTVTDELMSDEFGAISVEGVKKHRFLNLAAPWVASYSCDDARMAMSILRRINNRIKELKPGIFETARTVGAMSGDEVIDICEWAYDAELLRIYEMEILHSFGMTRDEFFLHGRQRFTEDQFTEIVKEIKGTHTGVTLMVAGFESDGEGRIFEISPWGVAKEQPLKYHAIGAGAPLALSTLYPLGEFYDSEELNDIVYRACAAKFNAENAPSVGESTYLFVQGQGGMMISMLWDEKSDSISQLRKKWKTAGQPPIPRGAKKYLKTHLRTLDLEKILRAAEVGKARNEGVKKDAPEA